MPLVLSTIKAVYELRQTATVTERETDQVPSQSTTLERHGLILLEADVKGQAWHRALTELVFPEDLMAEHIIGKQQVDLTKVCRLHASLVSKQKHEFGLHIPMPIESDLLNTRAFIPAGTDSGIPVRNDLLYLPTLLPTFPESLELEAGSAWEGELPVKFGAAEFTQPYQASVTTGDEQTSTLNLRMLPTPSTMTHEQFTLTRVGTGQANTTLSNKSGTPVSSHGTFQGTVTGQRRVGEVTSDPVKILDIVNKFAYKQVPVTFDDDTLDASLWRPGLKAQPDAD